jgi:hypothetical protein
VIPAGDNCRRRRCCAPASNHGDPPRSHSNSRILPTPLPSCVLSRELRFNTGPDLRRRRWELDLPLLGTVAGQIVT